MQRRRFFQTLIVAPAASAALAQQQTAPSARGPATPPEEPTLATVTPAEAGEPVLRFFTPEQFSALQRVGARLMPPVNGMPGALETHAAEFLDFLCSESLADRQRCYREGLDALNAQSRQAYGKPFSGLDDGQADALFAPLRRPWTYDPPAEPLARFLNEAKTDFRTATTNSREYATNGGAGGGRRMGGQGLYWNPLD